MSIDNILQQGERIYFDELKDILEPAHKGEYVVIDVESKDYFLDKDQLSAIKKGQEKYPNKLFYIVQVGTLERPTINFRSKKYAWSI